MVNMHNTKMTCNDVYIVALNHINICNYSEIMDIRICLCLFLVVVIPSGLSQASI